MKNSTQLIFAVVVTATLQTPPSQAALPLAKKVGEEISQRLQTKDEDFSATMKIIEADGSSKERQMQILRLSPSQKDHSIMVRMLKPQDLKGTALLAKMKNGTEERWIYLPSSKQTRRLTGEKAQGGILGSELNAEDFDFSGKQNVTSEVKSEIMLDNKKYFQVETDVAKTSPNYSRVVSFVSTENYLPAKVECYDKKGSLLKLIEFKNYEKVGGDKFRPALIRIMNVQNNRGTEISLSQIKVNQDLKSSRFTPQALSR